MLTSRRTLAVLTSLAVTATLTIAVTTPPAVAKPKPALDLETLTGVEAVALMERGRLTSVELTQAYIDRINALNKRGPGLNAVTQLNRDALKEAAQADLRRRRGQPLGPADGLPVLLKDLIDVKGMYTSAGNYSLRNSYPATDAPVTRKLRESGVVILGKVGLSEFANSFGSQPSGFGNLTGQVLHGLDTDQNPSGSSSGTGTAMAAAMSTLGIGTETSGSIISPSNAQSLVGLRPTVGLVPAAGIAPILASQDTAGPMTRTVSDAALTLASIAGTDPENDAAYAAVFGPDYLESGVVPPPPAELPDYLKALDANFVRGKKIGYNGNLTEGSPLKTAYDALVAAGAIMVPRPTVAVGEIPSLPSGYEQHKTIDEYYARLGPQAPIKSLAEEVADNQANAHQALKYGNSRHLSAVESDITSGGANETAYRENLKVRKAAYHKAIDTMLTYPGSDPAQPADPVIAILGSVPSGAQAGYPAITVPMGYNATNRRAQAVQVHGGAYDELDLLGVAYVIERATRLRQPASQVNPSMYRCAATVPAPPYSRRGACNPDYDAVMKLIGGKPVTLPFSLETESARSLSERLAARTLTSEQLVKAYLYRIALTNAEGPAVQAVRAINKDAVKEARALDRERGRKKTRVGPLYGVPVLLNDGFDVAGMETTGGSIALQDHEPRRDSTVVAKLRQAGAIILGKTNITELNGLFDTDLPEGYSSLGGQVLLPSDTDKTPAGSSAGSAAATAAGLAAFTVGMESSTDTAQLLAPADVAGVVGLKPTTGLVSRAGVLPVARSQDTPGPIARTVYDAAGALTAMAGPDRSDPATADAPVKDYTAGLSDDALRGKRIAVVAGGAEPYRAMVSALESLGATATQVEVGAPSPDPAGVVQREFERDLNAYLSEGRRGAGSLREIIDYNAANPVEGLKYQQAQLIEAEAVDLSDPATAEAYRTDLEAGRASTRALIDGILTNGTPEPSDDFDAVMVPSGDALVGHADRAGYPALTIPAGYGATTTSAGRNPVGVTFVGTAYSEATLLAGAYALEQATGVRQAPSHTNPSMWRCVPGSAFFTGEFCHPGDRLLTESRR
ncbi:amidase family protein [Nonomuraea terrae]|uniref:amidase family protein n=1 Tax=Nonomuraea terrae TaxID=2530383 RepID=UPI00379E559C